MPHQLPSASRASEKVLASWGNWGEEGESKPSRPACREKGLLGLWSGEGMKKGGCTGLRGESQLQACCGGSLQGTGLLFPREGDTVCSGHVTDRLSLSLSLSSSLAGSPGNGRKTDLCHEKLMPASRRDGSHAEKSAPATPCCEAEQRVSTKRRKQPAAPRVGRDSQGQG